MLSILIIAAVYPKQASMLAPKVDWAISRETVSGAPVFLQYEISNPNPFPIVVLMGEPHTRWFTVSARDADAPLKADLRARHLDESGPAPIQPLGPMARYIESFSLGEFAGACAPGRYLVSVHSVLPYRAGPPPSPQAWNDSATWPATAVKDESLTLRVIPASDVGLAAAALQIARSITEPGVAPAAGILPHHNPHLLADLLHMPAGPCAASWRMLLFSGRLPGAMLLPEAALAIKSNPDPTAARFATEIRDYMAKHPQGE